MLIANLIPGSATDLNATTGRSFTTNNVSPKIGLDYKTSGGELLYATYSRGYRGGSFNGQAYFLPEELSTTKSETVNAYEVGVKSTLLDRRLELNGAAFHYDYRNQQFIDVDPLTGAQPLVNLPLSRIYGAELELAARPIRTLKITGGVAYLHSRVQEGTLGGESIVGNSIVNAPKYSTTLAIDWDVVRGDWGGVSARVDGNYVSKQFFDLENRPTAAQGGYGLVNARVGWKSGSDKVGVDLWIRNIGDKFYATDKIDLLSGFGYIYNRVGDPTHVWRDGVDELLTLGQLVARLDQVADRAIEMALHRFGGRLGVFFGNGGRNAEVVLDDFLLLLRGRSSAPGGGHGGHHQGGEGSEQMLEQDIAARRRR